MKMNEENLEKIFNWSLMISEMEKLRRNVCLIIEELRLFGMLSCGDSRDCLFKKSQSQNNKSKVA